MHESPRCLVSETRDAVVKEGQMTTVAAVCGWLVPRSSPQVVHLFSPQVRLFLSTTVT